VTSGRSTSCRETDSVRLASPTLGSGDAAAGIGCPAFRPRTAKERVAALALSKSRGVAFPGSRHAAASAWSVVSRYHMGRPQPKGLFPRCLGYNRAARPRRLGFNPLASRKWWRPRNCSDRAKTRWDPPKSCGERIFAIFSVRGHRPRKSGMFYVWRSFRTVLHHAGHPLRIDLTHWPSRRQMAGVCAEWTAGVDVIADVADRGLGRLNWADSGYSLLGWERSGDTQRPDIP
jgi:hypothetical protein